MKRESKKIEKIETEMDGEAGGEMKREKGRKRQREIDR